MRLTAYLLAADPTWIEASVLSYYDMVETIVVSFDEDRRGWTGTPIAVDECLRRLREIDRDGKMQFVGGKFARLGFRPLENETFQRQVAIAAAAPGADWVLQLDGDEVLPEASGLREVLEQALASDVQAVEWPMRVLYFRLPGGQFLEICARDQGDHFEYPAPIAVRPTAVLQEARRAKGKFLRAVIAGDRRSLQVCRPAEARETRLELPRAESAILHNSWARSPANIKSKIASWGHNEGWRTRLYYYGRWRPTAWIWRWMRDFHPFVHGLWPALKPCQHLPAGIPASFFENVA